MTARWADLTPEPAPLLNPSLSIVRTAPFTRLSFPPENLRVGESAGVGPLDIVLLDQPRDRQLGPGHLDEAEIKGTVLVER